jgi:hypothetical protein
VDIIINYKHVIKATFKGNENIGEYKTEVFNAAPGNIVSMPETVWEDIKAKGDDVLFDKVESIDGEFPEQKTVYIPKEV